MELDIKNILLAAAGIAVIIFAAVKLTSPKDAASGKNNFSYTYKTTADVTYYSNAAAGKNGKVLIFGRPSCSFTRKTLQSLAGSNWISSANIDIAFLDIDNSPKQKIELFEKDINCKYITFCYGSAPHDDYIDLLPSSEISGNMIQLPLVAYIDSSDRIISVSSGPKTEDEIYKTMHKK